MYSAKRTVPENSLSGYWDWNMADNSILFSPAFKRFFGYADDELPNSVIGWRKLVFAEDHKTVLKNLEIHVKSLGTIAFKNELRYRHKNGSIIGVGCVGNVIEWGANNQPLRMVGYHTEINSQKDNGKESKTSEDLILKTNQAAMIGSWELNLGTDKFYWTDFVKQLYEVNENFEPDFDTAINFFKAGESREKIINGLNNAITSGASFNIESELLTAKGKSIWVRVIGQTEFQGNQCTRLYGSIQNIDHEIKSQQQLRIAGEQFRSAFEYSAIGMALVSLQGKCLKVNRQFCNFLGYSEQEMLHKNIIDITYPDDLERDLQLMGNLLRHEIEKYQIEKRYYRKDGEVVWGMLNVSLINDSSGNPLHFVSQIENITHRKNAKRALEERDALVTKLSEQLPGAIFQYIYHADGTSSFPFTSKGLYDVYELTPEEIKNDVSVILSRIHPEDSNVVINSVVKSYYENIGWECEYRVVLPEKGIRWLCGISTHQKLEDGSVVWHGYITDITDQKAREKQLQNTYDLVSEQNTRLINFAYIVSHNLRTHSGNFEMLVDLIFETTDEEEKLELMQHLKKVSGQLSETIVHLNDVVSIQTSIDQQRTKINLHSYVAKTTDVLALNMNLNDVVINNNVPSDLEFDYNSAYIESIIFNFLSNGIKYRHPDRQPVIAVDSYYEDKQLIMEISDNGLGIDMKKNADKLFGMYKTFHGNSDAKGIGLFITKSQVEAMGGKIEVDSEVNKGTTFKIYLS